jgi:hypothetical protein
MLLISDEASLHSRLPIPSPENVEGGDLIISNQAWINPLLSYFSGTASMATSSLSIRFYFA